MLLLHTLLYCKIHLYKWQEKDVQIQINNLPCFAKWSCRFLSISLRDSIVFLPKLPWLFTMGESVVTLEILSKSSLLGDRFSSPFSQEFCANFISSSLIALTRFRPCHDTIKDQTQESKERRTETTCFLSNRYISWFKSARFTNLLLPTVSNALASVFRGFLHL